LHVAVIKKHKDVVELLLSNGADVNVRNEAQSTPLHFAMENVDKGVAELLLSSGANPNVMNKAGFTPLTIVRYNFARYKGDQETNREILNLLLAKGARDK